MSAAPQRPTGYAIRVAINDAHLEFLVDGEGSYSAILTGEVETSNLGLAPIDAPFDITLSDIDPDSYGLVISPASGSLNYDMQGDQVEGVKTLAALARGRPGALYAEIRLLDEGRERGKDSRYWGAPRLTLGTRGLLSSAEPS